MADDRIKLRQLSLFREAERRGITRKQIALDGQFAESTVRSWASGEHEMPLWAFDRALATGALPLDLLTLLLPDGIELIRREGAMDHAALAGQALGYASDYSAARHPDSEAGEKLGHGEVSRLNARAAGMRA